MEASPVSRSVWEGRRAALVIAHPGHELLVHGWLEQARPLVCVLTVGAQAAIATTAQIIEQAGARIGRFFGRCTHRGLHHALLLGERERFNAIAQELADAFLSESIDFVVGDAAEGLDPVHDLCRVIVDAAVAIAAAVQPTMKNYDFPLLGRWSNRSSNVRQRIEGDAWERKCDSCRSYGEPIDEIQQYIVGDRMDELREECLRLATPWAIRNRRDVLYTLAEDGCVPAIRFREHLLPVAGSVQRFVTGGHPPAA